MTGYNPNFFTDLLLPMPQLTAAQKRMRAPLAGKRGSYVLPYTHFSIVVNRKRAFAFFTACNIDGNQWKAVVEQEEDFTYDKRLLPAYQTGNELYNLHSGTGMNDFDKGHIVKFQDPQWGDELTSRQAARDTMTFANCVPQHQSLNRGAWKSLEDYIIKNFTRKSGADGQKVSLFAGPVLQAKDPFYIDLVKGKPFRVPVHFWKVIVYRNKKGLPSAVAFLMSQKDVLKRYNFIVEEKKNIRLAKKADSADFFSNFRGGEPYQVRIDFIEKITGLKFGLQNLHHPYTKEEATEIIFKRVEIPAKKEGRLTMPYKDRPLPFTFEQIAL